MISVAFTKAHYLWMLGIVPLLVFVHFYSLKYGRKQALKFANFEAIRRVTGEKVVSKNVILLLMRAATITFLILAVSGTVLWYTGSSSKYDLVLAIDSSSSMLAEDYVPNRIESAKASAVMFIESLAGEIRIGLITFSGASFIENTLTSDLNEIMDAINNIETSTLGGTDIGQAIITSANLMQGEKPGVIVLITDGQDNVGIPVDDAIAYARKENIVVHTIGLGTVEGGKISGMEAAFKLDESTLQKIAAETGGQYFRPTSSKELINAFGDISEIRMRPMSRDVSVFLLIMALFFLFVEWGLIATKYTII
ncbi:MAG: VWA domain-containing protein [Candidatus Woesearchaeota archaeon]